MARAALRWNVKELAKRARIDSNTVVRFENGKHKSNETTVLMIRQAFETAGVRFIDDGVIVPPEAGREEAEHESD